MSRGRSFFHLVEHGVLVGGVELLPEGFIGLLCGFLRGAQFRGRVGGAEGMLAFGVLGQVAQGLAGLRSGLPRRGGRSGWGVRLGVLRLRGGQTGADGGRTPVTMMKAPLNKVNGSAHRGFAAGVRQ